MGGRTHSIKVGEDVWDMGAGWVGEKQPILKDLCKKFGIELYRQFDDGKHILIINGKKSTYSGNISTLNTVELGELDQAVKEWDKLMLEVKKKDIDAQQQVLDGERLTILT